MKVGQIVGTYSSFCGCNLFGRLFFLTNFPEFKKRLDVLSVEEKAKTSLPYSFEWFSLEYHKRRFVFIVWGGIGLKFRFTQKCWDFWRIFLSDFWLRFFVKYHEKETYIQWNINGDLLSIKNTHQENQKNEECLGYITGGRADSGFLSIFDYRITWKNLVYGGGLYRSNTLYYIFFGNFLTMDIIAKELFHGCHEDFLLRDEKGNRPVFGAK